MAYLHLAHTLADAFNALADEVQTLTDRKTVLEHKLRFAHEQVRNKTAYFLSGRRCHSTAQPGFSLFLSYPGRASSKHRFGDTGAELSRMSSPPQVSMMIIISSRSRASG